VEKLATAQVKETAHNLRAPTTLGTFAHGPQKRIMVVHLHHIRELHRTSSLEEEAAGAVGQ
jgi:hypothetical protein